MRILLTNDDGIHAEGLAALERIARQLSDDVWIVAPETDQSGLAHSLSLSEPLRLRKISEKHYALRGTPTDCVIMGVREVLPGAPDLVLSGINSGANIADDVTYSGTVAGAMEGTLLGIRSIAVSQSYDFDENGRTVPWETAEAHAPDLLRKLIAMDVPPGILFNVNFPKCAPDAVVGTVVTRQGKLDHELYIEQRKDGRGFPYYWLRFMRNAPRIDAGSDVEAILSDRISVTPLMMDLTAHDFRATLENALA